MASRARLVAIDGARLLTFAAELEQSGLLVPAPDPAHQRLADDDATLAYIVTLDAVNFGSGWFPVLDKRPGCSGYMTIATSLRERFEQAGAYSARDLASFDRDQATHLFGQEDAQPEAHELMELFARSLRDLGSCLLSQWDGHFAALVEASQASAGLLIDHLTSMPLYRDVARYGSLEVPLYKRAQITASDLAHAFGGEGYGRFDDLASLTLFADNLVPHVLRCEGVLRYAPGLAEPIDVGRRLSAGSSEEVEIRAVALHAVETMVLRLRERGWTDVDARTLDGVLWTRGQSPRIKARPRHRARSVFY